MNGLRSLDQTFLRWKNQRGRLRQIASTLPEAIDLLVVVMQAGLDFQVALEYYLQRSPAGPLRDELGLMQKEIRTGVSRAVALRHLKARVAEPSLQETARTLIQGIELGSSLTVILRAQAQALRKRRAYQAEKRAAVIPLKLMLPLFVFIFPTLFIVLFAPIFLTARSGGLLP